MLLRRRILIALLVLATANVAVFLVERSYWTPMRVPTQSMWPTLQRDDRVGIDHHVDLEDLKHGDLVVFAVSRKTDRPIRFRRDGNSKLVVKRVIALPGQTIEAHKGTVVVDQFDKRLKEPYLLGQLGDTEVPFQRLGKHEVFVLGDNRNKSVDSRTFGPVPASSVVGRVEFRYWPPNRYKNF